jgi:hypothetical protein
MTEPDWDTLAEQEIEARRDAADAADRAYEDYLTATYL